VPRLSANMPAKACWIACLTGRFFEPWFVKGIETHTLFCETSDSHMFFEPWFVKGIETASRTAAARSGSASPELSKAVRPHLRAVAYDGFSSSGPDISKGLQVGSSALQ